MKRFLAALLLVSLSLSLAGCTLFDGFSYIKAMNLYEDGNYEEALLLFEGLGDYADSRTLAALSKQKVDYAKAEALFGEGDYRPALELYTSLMLYEDSPIKAVRCQYALGTECMESGDYPQAVSWFDALGGYEDAPEKLHEAKWMWLYTYILDKGGTVEYAVNEEATQMLSLTAIEEGDLLLRYREEGQLLGMPYENELSVFFGRNSGDADYMARCSSMAASTIVEEAEGTLDFGAFVPGSHVEIGTFRQTITVELLNSEEPIEPVITEDPAQVLLVQSLFASAQQAVSEHLAVMLAQTGVQITARELGFTVTE